jgi:hydrogenase large subunit
MTRRVVGPFNRVEGDLEVTLDSDADGLVTEARVTAPLYRGFETILTGRAPLDALVIAPRICGICSISQSVAAARALSQALGVEPPANGRLAADLLLACENAADHLTHFALFFMPDFARADYTGRVWHDEAVRRFAALKGSSARAASAIRVKLLHVVGILAGKWPHSLALQPGGTAKSIDLGERMRLQGVLAEVRAGLEAELFGDKLETIASLSSPEALQAWAARSEAGDLRLFLRIAEDLRLQDWGRGPDRFLSHGGPLFAAGSWNAGVRSPLDLTGLREDLDHSWMAGEALHPRLGVTQPDADKPAAYSWCKAPRLGGASFEVGALARQLIAANPLAAGLVAASDGRGNVRDRVTARLVELAQLILAMEGWVKGMGNSGAYCHEPTEECDSASGVGLVEAARGALGHWLEIANGQIARYQIIAPTSWNFSPRDGAGLPGPLEQALVGVPAQSLLVQHVVRSFDPCLNCTVH